MEEAMKRDKLGQSTRGKSSPEAEVPTLKWVSQVAPAPSRALGRREVSSSV